MSPVILLIWLRENRSTAYNIRWHPGNLRHFVKTNSLIKLKNLVAGSLVKKVTIMILLHIYGSIRPENKLTIKWHTINKIMTIVTIRPIILLSGEIHPVCKIIYIIVNWGNNTHEHITYVIKWMSSLNINFR